jgi:hypothetical protein
LFSIGVYPNTRMSVLQAHGNLSEAKSSIQAIAETQSKLDNPGAAIPSAIKIDGSAEIDLLGDTQQKPVDIPHSPDTVSDFQKVNEIRVSLFRKWPCAIPPDPFPINCLTASIVLPPLLTERIKYRSYVAIRQAEPALRSPSMSHGNITDIYTYLRLCSIQHKRK